MKFQMPRLPGRVMVVASALLAAVTFHDCARAEDVPGITRDEIRIGSFGAFAGQGYLFGRLTMDGIDAVFHKVNVDGGVTDVNSFSFAKTTAAIPTRLSPRSEPSYRCVTCLPS
jgi:hypothetical protein